MMLSRLNIKDFLKVKFLHTLYKLFFAIAILIAFNSCTVAYNLQFIKDDNTLVQNKWVGTWATAPQLVEPHNNPPSPGLSHNTIRQIVRVSLGGDSIRVRFSNEFSSKPVVLKSVHLAVSLGNGKIDPATDKEVYFNGKPQVIIDAGNFITSDVFQFKLNPRQDIAITIYFGDTPTDITGHPGSRTTSYILTGNEVVRTDFSDAIKTDHWYIINGIDVLASDSANAVVILGNSITDGRGSGTNKQNRWPDELVRRLHENSKTKNMAVLNMGIGGNCVLKDCLGPAAITRFKRDVLDQNGVKWLIIFEGINDIGQARGPESSQKVANDLIKAYQEMIDIARKKGIIVFGATLLPFGGSSYDSPNRQDAWKTVNDWIRNSGSFDGVIDLERALCDPENNIRIIPIADSGDHLHPNETGHRMIAEAVDIYLFIDHINNFLRE